jgi:hypothetical protein
MAGELSTIDSWRDRSGRGDLQSEFQLDGTWKNPPMSKIQQSAGVDIK